MKFKKSILEEAFEDYNRDRTIELITWEDFPKYVAKGMKLLQEEYEEQQQGFFVSHIREGEDSKAFYAALAYNILLPNDDPHRIGDPD